MNSYWSWFKDKEADLSASLGDQDVAELLEGFKWLSNIFPTGSNFVGLAHVEDIKEFAKSLQNYNRFWFHLQKSKPGAGMLLNISKARRMLVVPVMEGAMDPRGLLVYDGYTYIRMYRGDRPLTVCSGLSPVIDTLFVLDRVYGSAALQSIAADSGYGSITTAVPAAWRGYKPCVFKALRGCKIGNVVVCSKHSTCSGAFTLEADAHYRAKGFLRGHEWDKYDLERLLNLHPDEVERIDKPEGEVLHVTPENKNNPKGSKNASRKWKDKCV